MLSTCCKQMRNAYILNVGRAGGMLCTEGHNRYDATRFHSFPSLNLLQVYFLTAIKKMTFGKRELEKTEISC